ncbi:MAG: type VI secretion system contractile sheath large subunit [Myxococcota bacterium]
MSEQQATSSEAVVEEQDAPKSLMDELLNEAQVRDVDEDAYRIAKRGIQAFMGELLQGREKYGKIERAIVDQMIAQIDQKIANQVNEVLHNTDFQKLEGTWRSIRYLVDHSDSRENVKIELLDVTKQCLIDDFEDSSDITKSGLYRTVYSAEYGTFGGHPYGAMISGWEFNAGHEDIRLLQNLASIAAMAHAPLLANAAPQFFGEDDFHELPRMRDLKALFESPQYLRWRSFRDSEDSRYVGLCMPRFLLRVPYDKDHKPVKNFDFSEDVIDKHDNYLWGPASYALAARCAESFAAYRWCPNIIGPLAGGAVEDLPVHQYEAMGSLQTKLPIEIQLTERREYELSEEGFIGLTYRKNSDNAAFFSANSCQRPRFYGDTEEGRANELNFRLGTQLPYMFIITRLAHYIKVIQRENLGSWKTAAELRRELKKWLLGYTSSGPKVDAITKSKRPFQATEVLVDEVPGQAGWYRCEIQVMPHFKYMGADFTLSLVGKLDKQ